VWRTWQGKLLSVSAKNKLPYLSDSDTQALLGDLTFELRDLARNSGWPERIINFLSVIAQDGNITISYPDKLASEIDYLEFGDLNDLPNAVLRPFVARIDGYIGKNVGGQMLNNILMGSE